MAELTLHSFRRCPFAIRVRMALEEKGLKYGVIEENLNQPSGELLKINPSGQVPVLIHRGQVIPESSVINEYLEEVFPLPPLMPETSAGRAQVRLWTLWCAENFKPAIDTFKYKWDSLSSKSQAELLVLLRDGLTRLESQLAKRPFILGEELTLADIHLFPFFRQLTRARLSEPALLAFPPRSIAWLDSITSRPSFMRAMAR